jgi:single-stranded-DNA-specific exonuclease
LTPHPEGAASLRRDLGLPAMVAHVLAVRGITGAREAEQYLNGSLDDLHDPMLMRDMPEAVACLRGALAEKRRIRIFGDYDADGVTATALLVRALEALGADVDYYIPHRIADGYGLNAAAIEQAARDGVGLGITVDCGISDHEHLGQAQALGLDVVVTDHHEPPAELPPAAALLNPKRADCPYPFKDLSGVGVAYKLLAALSADLGLRAGAERAFLDLVAIGTIADVVSLTGENRLLVKHGLEVISATRKHGISALMRAISVTPPVTSYNVAFGLAPRLNAAGRLDHARGAVTLLLTSDLGEADKLAQSVCRLNTERQQEELRTLEAAEGMIRSAVDLERDRLILLASEEWHPGVIGVVASRLLERYHRPVVLLAMSDGEAKGSARSVPGFHICDAIGACADLLEDYGGHALAAGFSTRAANTDALRERLLARAAEVLAPEDLTARVTLDAWATLDDLDLAAVESINAMAPFGSGNPRPLIGLRDVGVQACDTVGADGKHLRLTLGGARSSLGAIWFGFGHIAARLEQGATVDVCGLPEIDEWNGRRTVRLKVHDLAV